MSLFETVKKLAEEEGMTLYQLNNKAGLGANSIYSWKTSTPKANTLEKVAQELHVSVSDILKDNKSNITFQNNASKEDTTKTTLQSYHVRLPVIGKICNTPILAEENIKYYIDLILRHRPCGTLFILEHRSQSMEPTIPDGSMVTIKIQDDVENGELAAVLSDDEVTIKRVYKESDCKILKSDNKYYGNTVLDKQHPGKIIGKVIHVDYDPE